MADLKGKATATDLLRGKISSPGSAKGTLSGLEKIQGYSAYEVAVINGFVGSEEEWLESLKGDPGPAGPQGEPGFVQFEELTDEQKEMLRGYPGEDGVDGYSPTIAVATITGGHRVSVTDVNGTQYFNVMDGKDGGGGSGSGDMLASMYDPQNKRQDIFAYVDEKTKDIDVDVTADEVTFADGETFQQKYDSGELRGADGQPGADGYTPQKGVDYFDGKDGSNGKDGVSVTHSWNGTTLSVTSASGTSSANLKGGKGDTGPAGADAKINGVNTLTLTTDEYLSATQTGSTLKLGLKSAPSSLGANTYTLTTSGWSDNGDGRFKQTISVPGVTTDASQVIMVDAALTGTDLDADAATLGAWGPDDGSGPSSQNVAQGSGTLTFYCTAAPTVNIPVYVGVS